MNLRITHTDLPFVAKIQLGAPAWVVRSVMHHPGVSRALQSPDLQRYSPDTVAWSEKQRWELWVKHFVGQANCVWCCSNVLRTIWWFVRFLNMVKSLCLLLYSENQGARLKSETWLVNYVSTFTKQKPNGNMGLPCHPNKPVGFLAFGAKYMGFPLWSPLPIEGGSRAIGMRAEALPFWMRSSKIHGFFVLFVHFLGFLGWIILADLVILDAAFAPLASWAGAAELSFTWVTGQAHEWIFHRASSYGCCQKLWDFGFNWCAVFHRSWLFWHPVIFGERIATSCCWQFKKKKTKHHLRYLGCSPATERHHGASTWGRRRASYWSLKMQGLLI